MEAGAAGRGATATGEETTAVATRLAVVCDMIEEHRSAGTVISARRAAAIFAMIEDVASTAAEGMPRAGRRRRRRRRMGSARWYEEVCRLGEGAFGVVVRARHRATGEDVAVKSLLREGRDDDGLADLLREACFMAACRGHPSLLTLRGVTRRPGTMEHSLVMDYVGPSLIDVLVDRGRPFPEADVRGIMRQLLAGAEAMHRHGIAHRDIKPENILVGDGGAVRICDFGSAKSMAKQDPTYPIAGTIDYMAPEVLVHNTDHGTPVDAWSLGCVMAELLTGEQLFSGEDKAEQLREIFDVLGVPGERAWQALQPRVLADEVQQWRAQQRQQHHRNRLRELFPDELLSEDGFEVLKGLLTCDPSERLTAAAALRCAWFTDGVVDDARVPAAAATLASKIGAAAKKLSSLTTSFVEACNFLGRRHC